MPLSMEQKGLDFGPGAEKPKPQRRTWTVSQLTDRLQGVLETEFFDVWVEGEVSNVTMPASGHWYFSLKDSNAQVRAVVWKTAARLIKFKPRDGMKVLVRGAVRVYPPKGEYQIAVEVIEPLGKGSLQQAFEELKAKLEKEGLFETEKKRRLLPFPRTVGVVTSRDAAALRDVLTTLKRRDPSIAVILFPVRVQGEGAAEE